MFQSCLNVYPLSSFWSLLAYASWYWTNSQELGEKKRKEEEKKEKEEAEQKALQVEAATKSHEELMEMRQRLGKIEETIKEIVLETKKPSGNAPTKTQEDQSTKLSPKEVSQPEKEHKGNVQKPGDGPHWDD